MVYPHTAKSAKSLFRNMLTLSAGLILAGVAAAPAAAADDDQAAAAGDFTDPRDGQVYRWVRIGDQIWMAENLRYAPDTGSKCWNDEETECGTRGRFYDWRTACTVAPAGWHLPGDGEWKTLERQLGLPDEFIDGVGLERGGERNTVGATIKRPGAWPTEYDGRPLGHTDATGFSAVPTGFYALGGYTHDGYAGWWTGSGEGERAWVRALGFHTNMMTRALNDKAFYMAVRCVRDTSSSD